MFSNHLTFRMGHSLFRSIPYGLPYGMSKGQPSWNVAEISWNPVDNLLKFVRGYDSPLKTLLPWQISDPEGIKTAVCSQIKPEKVWPEFYILYSVAKCTLRPPKHLLKPTKCEVCAQVWRYEGVGADFHIWFGILFERMVQAGPYPTPPVLEYHWQLQYSNSFLSPFPLAIVPRNNIFRIDILECHRLHRYPHILYRLWRTPR